MSNVRNYLHYHNFTSLNFPPEFLCTFVNEPLKHDVPSHTDKVLPHTQWFRATVSVEQTVT